MGLFCSSPSYSSILEGKSSQKRTNRVVKTDRRLQADSADADVAGHHALAAHGLEDALQLLTLAEAVKEDGQRADVHGVRAQPDQVRVQPHQLVEEHAQPLRLLRNLQPQQLLDGQRVGRVVGHRGEVVDAIRQRDYLLVELRLAGLLDAGVQVADVGRERDYRFAVDLQHQSQHAVCRRVLRPHVDDHGVVLRGVGTVVAACVGNYILNAGNNHLWSGKRGH